MSNSLTQSIELETKFRDGYLCGMIDLFAMIYEVKYPPTEVNELIARVRSWHKQEPLDEMILPPGHWQLR